MANSSVSVPKSSIDDPLGYFKAIFESNYLSTLRKNFFPDDSEKEFLNASLYNIDPRKETYSYEIKVPDTSKFRTDVPFDPLMIGDILEDKIYETYAFSDTLKAIFKIEADRTKTLFDKRIEIGDNGKNLCILWTDRIRKFIEMMQEIQFKKYKSSSIYLTELHQYILETYSTYSEGITPLDRTSKYKRERRQMQPSIFKEIATLKIDGEYLFEFQDRQDDLEVQEKITTLRSIVTGIYNGDEKPLIYLWEKQRFAYLLFKLKEFYKTFDWVKPVSKNVIGAKSKEGAIAWFNDDLARTSLSKIKSSAKHDSFKKEIDAFFESHIEK